MFHRSFRAALAISVLSAAAAFAALPTFWTVSTEAEFLRGEVENLSIDSYGRLTLGQRLRFMHAGATHDAEEVGIRSVNARVRHLLSTSLGQAATLASGDQTAALRKARVDTIEGLVDEVVTYVAPMLLGAGRSAVADAWFDLAPSPSALVAVTT